MRRTQPLTTLACILWGPPLEKLASRMDNWVHSRCGADRVRFLASTLFPAAISPLVLCYGIACLLCRVLISPTQSGSDDGHMPMYSLFTRHRLLVGSPKQPQRAKLRCIRKKIILALPIARPPPSGRIGLCPLLARGLLAVSNWLRYQAEHETPVSRPNCVRTEQMN